MDSALDAVFQIQNRCLSYKQTEYGMVWTGGKTGKGKRRRNRQMDIRTKQDSRQLYIQNYQWTQSWREYAGGYLDQIGEQAYAHIHVDRLSDRLTELGRLEGICRQISGKRAGIHAPPCRQTCG